MIRDLLLWLVTIFVVEPVQGRYERQLAGMESAPAILRDVRQCTVAAPAALVARVTAEPGWAVGRAVDLVIGRDTPSAVLERIVPECGTALAAARAALGRGPSA